MWEPRPGRHVEYGAAPGFEEGAKPIWGLSQWSSKFPIVPAAKPTGASGFVVMSNAAKRIMLGPPGADLSLTLNSGEEYGAQARAAGDPWVHLLVEQEFETPPFLQKLSAARFHLGARLLHARNLHRDDYDPAVHAAQFQVFLTVQNRNRQSPGYGDLLWFGIPVYDNRHRTVPEFKSKDFGGTEKFIFTPAGTTFTSESLHDGAWVVIDQDLLPLMREALDMAWGKGFLSASKSIADYAIGGMNMGWELPGTFDVELAVRDLSLMVSEGTGVFAAAGNAETQNAPVKELPLPGEAFLVEGHTAFIIPATKTSAASAKPWVWYAPTLPGLPGQEEQWMFHQLLQAGISVAGIDIGESFGSPSGRALFSLFHRTMTARGYSSKAVLLGRSRGGLMTLSWAVENPEKVGGFAGIYPVCNVASYPGIAKAAAAYGMSANDLEAHQQEHNPIDRLAPLAQAGVPLFAIHGDADTVVPLNDNSGLMRDRYRTLGGSMQLIVPSGQGHNMWPGFFQNQELVDFVKAHAGPAGEPNAK